MLQSGLSIRLISAPVLIATKLEAFNDRGHSADGQPDYLGSHDLEDIITVVDRRPELLTECTDSSSALREYLAQSFGRLLADPDFNTTLAVSYTHLDVYKRQNQARPLGRTGQVG